MVRDFLHSTTFTDKAKWISDGSFTFTEKKTSPRPMVFRKNFTLRGKVAHAHIQATALGIYELELNERKVGEQFFAPGFTSYAHHLQHQTYDVTGLLRQQNELLVTIAGGWAVGSYTMSRKNRLYADRQALLLEMTLEYENGETEVIGSDDSWQVSTEGAVLAANLYDGETVDATVYTSDIPFRQATLEKLRINPELIPQQDGGVKAHEVFTPVSVSRTPTGMLLYDFGQNFAGIVQLHIKNAQKGQKIVVRHAEVLNRHGELNTKFLRSAKATVTYFCKDGEQGYRPRFTYMGFRYVTVEGINQEDIEVTATALYSDIPQIGSFRCSNELLNRLQENIQWSAKSNFVEIPTDCPQRDERLGWTGDIALFAPTACFNFDMQAFLRKWLRDVRAEQLPTGGIPNTVPAHHYRFPYTLYHMATDFWGDVILLAPWAVYQATGNREVLEENYDAMKRYVDACHGWAKMLSFGKHRYIWHTPGFCHYGDWAAPDGDYNQWVGRSKWTATASLYNTTTLLSEIAMILGNTEDVQKYQSYAQKVAQSYSDILLNGTGTLTKEFQTGYVLPLYFGMLEGESKENALQNLVKLVKKNDYCIGTGFPGTPYILFVLADNGYADVAYKMLLNTKCPSWLHAVKVGATTIWERWDALADDGSCPWEEIKGGGMVSFNHYASGAVGDFLYRRVAGLEAIEPGYRKFRVKPVPGGDITWAECETQCPNGTIRVRWEKTKGIFRLAVTVPADTECTVILPSGKQYVVGEGEHNFREEM